MIQSPMALQYSSSVAPWEASPLYRPNVILPKRTHSCKAGGIRGMLGIVLSV